MDFKNITATELPNDVLRVTGELDSQVVVAQGWVSATTNFYPNDERDENGHRVSSDPPRKMTDKEKESYYTQLLQEAVNASLLG